MTRISAQQYFNGSQETNVTYGDRPLLETDILPAFVTDNREERRLRNLQENQAAVDAFIREWWCELDTLTPTKHIQSATAPGAPAKPAMPRHAEAVVDIDSIATRLEDMFGDCITQDASMSTIPDTIINYTPIYNAIQYGHIANRRIKIGKHSTKK